MDTITLSTARPELPAIPHRKLIRSWLQPVAARDSLLAVGLLLFDLLLFGVALAVIIAIHSLPLKLLSGVLCGFIIARLFIIGHDACHQSYTAHRSLNAWLGRIAFAPSLTPYSLWDTGHNVVHHGYTNLKGFDMVWEPLTLQQYRDLPAWRRMLERCYRSGLGPWLYYLVEMWWLRMYFPSPRYMPTRRKVFVWDGALVTVIAAAWIGLLVHAAHASGQSVALLISTGFLLPFLVWNALIGFVVYVHHTHTRIAWHADKPSWSAAQPFVSTTVHLTFRSWLGLDMDTVLHHIMQHTAHHVDMTIPLYRLKRAQAILEARMPGRIVIQPFSWRWYFDTARRCKLYDFDNHRWTDFSGRPTTDPVIVPVQ